MLLTVLDGFHLVNDISTQRHPVVDELSGRVCGLANGVDRRCNDRISDGTDYCQTYRRNGLRGVVEISRCVFDAVCQSKNRRFRVRDR